MKHCPIPGSREKEKRYLRFLKKGSGGVRSVEENYF
jgi:hypothetical protein